MIIPRLLTRAKALQYDLFKITTATIACFSNCIKGTREAYPAIGQIVAFAQVESRGFQRYLRLVWVPFYRMASLLTESAKRRLAAEWAAISGQKPRRVLGQDGG